MTDLLPLYDPPAWVDYLLADLALAVGLGTLGSYLVVVFPDPGPLIALPRVLMLAPVVWMSIALVLGLFPFLRRYRIGERLTVWWEEHIA